MAPSSLSRPTIVGFVRRPCSSSLSFSSLCCSARPRSTLVATPLLLHCICTQQQQHPARSAEARADLCVHCISSSPMPPHMLSRPHSSGSFRSFRPDPQTRSERLGSARRTVHPFDRSSVFIHWNDFDQRKDEGGRCLQIRVEIEDDKRRTALRAGRPLLQAANSLTFATRCTALEKEVGAVVAVHYTFIQCAQMQHMFSSIILYNREQHKLKVGRFWRIRVS